MYGRGQLCKLNDSSINDELRERQRRKDPPLFRRKLMVPCTGSQCRGVWGRQGWRTGGGHRTALGFTFTHGFAGALLRTSARWRVSGGSFASLHQGHLRRSPSLRALLESSKWPSQALNCNHGGYLPQPPLPLLLLLSSLAALQPGTQAMEGYQPTCRAIAWPFSCIFYPSLNPWALCAGATSHMLKMLKSKHSADCTSMRSQRGSEQ